MENFDETKWADITPMTDPLVAECDITTMKTSVFSFDLDAWATACATVAGCTFDETAYVQYALGFLWKQGGVTPCTEDGPYIMTKPGRTSPFEGLYWNHNPNYLTLYYDVTYNDSTFQFGALDSNECYDFLFLEGCFADLRENANDPDEWNLTFSLLASTTGLEEESEHVFHVLWNLS